LKKAITVIKHKFISTFGHIKEILNPALFGILLKMFGVENGWEVAIALNYILFLVSLFYNRWLSMILIDKYH
jgi:hypothetical protein